MELLAEEEENRKRLTILNHRGSSHEKIIEELKRIRKNLQLKRNHYGIYTISRSSTQTLTNEQLKIVATFIPDEILEHPNDTKIRKFECALFFADVSGYTDLSTKYQYVENGASKLSNVMNTYLGSMVQEIFAHKGDILKYAGDAFIAIFKVGNEISMQECVRRAIDTALIIQKNSSFRTEVGVELSVKITISAGEVLFSVVGDSNSSYYVIIGDPIWDSKAMQSKIKAGEILVNSRTWLFANDSLYRFKFLREHQIYKVLSFRDNMIEVLQRQHETLLYFNEQSKKAVDESEMSSKSMTEMTSTVYDRSYERIALAEMTQKKSLFKVRSNIDISLENRSRKFLRRFLLKPLMKLIDSGEAIETLLEMRRVVVVFANFVVNYKSAEDLIDITQRIYTTLTRIVTDFEGTDNKITLFDKDMMFVAIFGLRGMKHEREARVALRCAAAIHQTFQSWQNEIRTVSLGISTGNCFCGFVGHTLRREFSVISVTVNTAARLMMAYPNIVSCDQETVFDSKLLFRHFERLPKKAMKGLNDKVLAFKFIDWKITDEMNSLNLFKERKFSFVGRKNDLKLAIDFIQEQNSSDECCLLIQGENEDGKTRLLIEISDFSKLNGIRCIFIPLFLQHRRKQFHTLRRVICEILEVNEENLTTRINEMLEITPSENDFWMLNSVLDTTFSVPKNPTNEDTFNSGGNIFEEFRKFIEFIVVEKITILIDDLELVDKSSLDYLHTIFHNEKTSCVLTLGNHRSVKERFLEILGQRHVKRCQLEPLSLDEQNSLAFQFLDVVELSKDLQEFIHNNSKGNPGWILTSLNWFQELNQIEILSSEKSGSIAKFKSSENVDEISKRLLTPNNDNDLMIFDKLPTFEQFVCKCAAVLGNEFPRKKLAFLLSKGSERQLGKAIVRLFENQIFTCGSAIPTSTERVSTNTCHCEQLTISDACRDLPITSSCSMLKFQKPSFREIVYQLLGEKQRIEFHEKALVFLHLNTRKCKSCGYEPFAFVWEQETDFKFHDGTLHNKKDKSLTDMIDYFDSLCLPISKDSKTRKSKWNCSANSMEVLPIILNYAAYNFNDCECYSILSKMYKEMINHCHGGKNFLKLIDTKIKFARMVLVRSNYENVDEPNKLLTRALHQLEINNLRDGTRYSDLLRGRALTLQGICYNRLAQYREALECFRESCRIFSLHVPDDSQKWMTRLKFKFIVRRIKSLLIVKQIPNCSKLTYLATRQLSKTLTHMSETFLATRQFELAKFAAFWSLEKTLEYGRHFREISKSFGNVLHVIHRVGESRKYFWLLKATFIQVCRSTFIGGVNLDGLYSVMRIYQHSMICFAQLSDLSNSVKVGQLAVNLCFQTQTQKSLRDVVPILFTVLMSLKRFQEAISLLTKLYSVASYSNEIYGLIWYHALSMDFLLDTGNALETYENCKKFYFQDISNLHEKIEDESLLRLFTNFLTFSSRLNQHEDKHIWMTKLKTFKLEKYSSLNQIFTALRLYESSDEEKDFHNTIERDLRMMKNFPQFLRVRFSLLNIQKKSINTMKTKRNGILKRLDDLKNRSIKNRNFLCVDLIKHFEESLK